MDDLIVDIEVRLRTRDGREIRRRVTHSLLSVALTSHNVNAVLDHAVASLDVGQVWRAEKWAEELLSSIG